MTDEQKQKTAEDREREQQEQEQAQLHAGAVPSARVDDELTPHERLVAAYTYGGRS